MAEIANINLNETSGWISTSKKVISFMRVLKN